MSRKLFGKKKKAAPAPAAEAAPTENAPKPRVTLLSAEEATRMDPKRRKFAPTLASGLETILSAKLGA
jgi:hypothetical protein